MLAVLKNTPSVWNKKLLVCVSEEFLLAEQPTHANKTVKATSRHISVSPGRGPGAD
jgi:hypothetical protein